MLRRTFVQQPERVRQALGVQDLQLAVVVHAGEVTGLLPTPVENEHRTVARERGGECRRRGVRHVMRYVAELGRIEAGQRFGQELPADVAYVWRRWSHGSCKPSSRGGRCKAGSNE